MMISLRQVCPLILFLLLTQLSNGQVKIESNLRIAARVVDGTQVFKILPDSKPAWFLGMKKGYNIEYAVREGQGWSDYRQAASNLLPNLDNISGNLSISTSYADAITNIITDQDYVPREQTLNEILLADKDMSRHYLTFIMLSSYSDEISESSGLQFALEENLEGMVRFRIRINDHPEYTSLSTVNTGNLYNKIPQPKARISVGDKIVKFIVNHEIYNRQIVAYQLERSENGSDYQKIGAPRVFNQQSEAGKDGLIWIHDSIPENYQTYYYRIRGYDYFGYLSEAPEEPIIIVGRDQTAPYRPYGAKVEQTAPQSIRLEWNYDIEQADLQGFQVITSEDEQGVYKRLHKELLSRQSRSFEYTFPAEVPRFYRVLSVDTARNAAASDLAYLVKVDTIPPNAPDFVTAESDTNRVVTVSWDKSAASDLKGYRVFKAYHPSHGFTPLTPKPLYDTLFVDTVGMERLEKKVYYKVVALDKNFNHSSMSEAAIALLPDHIPPTAPLLVEADIDDNKMLSLEWKPSSSADVESYVVHRYNFDDSVYVSMGDSLPPETNESLVSLENLHDQSFAEVYLVAIDSSGNVSPRSNGKRVLIPSKLDKEIKITDAEQTDEGVVLQFSRNTQADEEVLIYRTEGGGKIKILDRVVITDNYVDASIKEGQEYSYRASTVKKTGFKSALSDPIKIEVR